MLKAYELTERTRKSEKGQKAVASRAHWRYFNAPAQVGQSERNCGTNTLQLAMDGWAERTKTRTIRITQRRTCQDQPV